jgi:hypothetical protein
LWDRIVGVVRVDAGGINKELCARLSVAGAHPRRQESHRQRRRKAC